MQSIATQNIGKKYELYRKPKDRLIEWLLLGKKKLHKDFWALKEISFGLEKGKTLGLIGPNGAGKTTLLKLISGTTYPTEGELYVNGKVSSLLELGAGFHPEFTGRENIYMNAAILGLSQKEIEAKYDQIVEFAELGDFIERPVKTYSSGMYMRLGFSVAISVEPDILIIDEVLAVGDENFQKKCIDKINNLRESDKTILFCSHNMALVRLVCDEVLWLNRGEIVTIADPISATDEYMNMMRDKKRNVVEDGVIQDQNMPHFRRVYFIDGNEEYQFGGTLSLNIEYEIPKNFQEKVHVGLVIARNDNVRVFTSGSTKANLSLKESGTLRFTIPELPLLSGNYFVHLFMSDESKMHFFDKRRNAAKFTVVHEGLELGIVDFPNTWELT